MSKRCARCEKAVYPLEELKCLDKIWHKGCFKCQECGMTLSMKTYKGFNKLPYCEAHIPKAKATTVAETPEMRRLAENTKIQSNVQYHADFEKNKAKFTQVADDPETQRLKKNTQIISNVVYHGEMAKKSEMERKRAEPGDENEAGAPPPREDDMRQQEQQLQHQMQQQQHQQQHQQQQQQKQQQLQKHHQQLPQQHQQQQYTSPHQQQYSGPPPSSQHRHPSQPSSTSFLHHQQPYQQHPHKQQLPPTSSYHHHPTPQNMFHDANHNSPYSSRTSQTLIYSSQTGPVHQQPTRRVGSIADYDPVNEQYGSISQHNANPAGGGYRQETTYQVQRTNLYGDQNMGQQPPPSQMNSNPTHHKVTAPPTQLGRCYRAMYDYEAADTDEVSFKDGDLIINCTAIDEGWMTGTIQRTGITGMLPANYVERVS